MYRAIDRALTGLVTRLQLFANERGQTLAEYSLVLTLVAVGVTVPTLLIFRQTLAGAFNDVVNCIDGGC